MEVVVGYSISVFKCSLRHKQLVSQSAQHFCISSTLLFYDEIRQYRISTQSFYVRTFDLVQRV